MTTAKVAVLLLLAALSAPVRGDLAQLDKPESVLEVVAAVGLTASLPCATAPRAGPAEAPLLLLWYSESAPDDGVPIYRVDARGLPLSRARLWSSPSWFGPRASLVVDRDRAHLVVTGLREQDQGVYRCRADFRDQPTRNTRIALTVTVPPSQLLVTRLPLSQDGTPGAAIESLPPLVEGEELSLACEAVGGRPRPSVVWLLGDVVVADSWEVAVRPDGAPAVVSRLLLPALGRQHLHGRLVCRAANNAAAPPLDKELFLDVLLRPLSARIVGPGRSLLAGQPYEFQCRCTGSRPAASIAWSWKGSDQAPQGPVRKLAGSATETISVLTLTPLAEHHGRHIVCRASNAAFQDSDVWDEWRLSVQYAPRVRARLGAKVNASNVETGTDVYLECAVDANPAAGPVTWEHNGEPVQSSLARGVLVTASTLVLQRVSRRSTGDYACSAGNAVARAHSAPVTLIVRYAPECRHRDAALVGALLHETVSLACSVDAVPAPTAYHWSFQDAAGAPPRRHQHRQHQQHQQQRGDEDAVDDGTVTVTPRAAKDFGTFACRAENAVGQQERPCLVRLVHAGLPLAPANCSMARLLSPAERPAELRLGTPATPPLGLGLGTAEHAVEPAKEPAAPPAGLLRVDCRAAAPSGLPEHYMLQLVRDGAALPLYNLTLPVGAPPVWELAWAPEPGAAYSALLHAVNAKGRSEATVLDGGPLRGPDPVAGPSNQPGDAAQPLLSGLVATSCALLLVATGALLVLAVFRPRRRAPQHGEDAVGDPAAATSLLADAAKAPTPSSQTASADDDADPDVIPTAVPRASSGRTSRPGRRYGKTPPPTRRRDEAAARAHQALALAEHPAARRGHQQDQVRAGPAAGASSAASGQPVTDVESQC